MEKINKVSIWIGEFSSKDFFEDYIALTYSEDGDITSKFMKDFKIEYYDEQFKESLFTKDKDKLKDFSYASTFYPKIIDKIDSKINSFLLLYNFEYDSKNNKNDKMKFIGTFDYKL